MRKKYFLLCDMCFSYVAYLNILIEDVQLLYDILNTLCKQNHDLISTNICLTHVHCHALQPILILYLSN